MKRKQVKAVKSSLRKGDPVMVIAGGNDSKRPIKGKTGKILRFTGDGQERAFVEGVNVITKRKKATGPDKPGGEVQTEASIHVSNLMYYVDKLEKCVRLKHKQLEDGRKVRGYIDKEKGEFVQIDA